MAFTPSDAIDSLLGLTNPGELVFPGIDGTNTASWKNAADTRTALGLGTANSPTFAGLNITNFYHGFGAFSLGGGQVLLGVPSTGLLLQANGTTAQTFGVANTVSGGNYERGIFGWSSNALKIGTEALGTGTARDVQLMTGGTTRLTIGASGDMVFLSASTVYQFGTGTIYLKAGASSNQEFNLQGAMVKVWCHLVFSSDNTFDIGAASANRPRAIYAAGTIKGNLTTLTAYTAAVHTATGYLTIYDSTGTAYKVAASL